MLVGAAYYRHALADLAAEIDNCYSKITYVACFCPAEPNRHQSQDDPA